MKKRYYKLNEKQLNNIKLNIKKLEQKLIKDDNGFDLNTVEFTKKLCEDIKKDIKSFEEDEYVSKFNYLKGKYLKYENVYFHVKEVTYSSQDTWGPFLRDRINGIKLSGTSFKVFDKSIIGVEYRFGEEISIKLDFSNYLIDDTDKAELIQSEIDKNVIFYTKEEFAEECNKLIQETNKKIYEKLCK